MHRLLYCDGLINEMRENLLTGLQPRVKALSSCSLHFCCPPIKAFTNNVDMNNKRLIEGILTCRRKQVEHGQWFMSNQVSVVTASEPACTKLIQLNTTQPFILSFRCCVQNASSWRRTCSLCIFRLVVGKAHV